MCWTTKRFPDMTKDRGTEGQREILVVRVDLHHDMTHSQMLGKFEYTRGPIFKVVLEC